MHRKHTSYLADAIVNLGWAALLGGDPERARALYAESMRMCLELGDTLAAPVTLLGLAYAGSGRAAARLFGACEALREVMGTPPEPGESALQEPYLSAALPAGRGRVAGGLGGGTSNAS